MSQIRFCKISFQMFCFFRYIYYTIPPYCRDARDIRPFFISGIWPDTGYDCRIFGYIPDIGNCKVSGSFFTLARKSFILENARSSSLFGITKKCKNAFLNFFKNKLTTTKTISDFERYLPAIRKSRHTGLSLLFFVLKILTCFSSTVLHVHCTLYTVCIVYNKLSYTVHIL